MLLKKIFVATAMTFGVASAAFAGVLIKPDANTYNVTSIDYPQTSFLADNGIQAITNFQAGSGSTSFNVYTHAMVSLFNGVQPAGITSGAYEITMVTSFTETVTGVLPGFAQFSATATSGFYQLYLDTSPNANNLTGTGFNDGKLIAVGALSNSPNGNFTLQTCAGGGTVLLDGFGADDWAGQQTVCGFGSNNALDFAISAFDPTVFINGVSNISLNFSNISIALPFAQVDPSKCFSPSEGRTGADVGNSQTSSNCTATGNGLTPGIGAINGVNGPDFMAQTDYNSSISGTYVPEPGSLALLAGALLAGGFASRRREKR